MRNCRMLCPVTGAVVGPLEERARARLLAQFLSDQAVQTIEAFAHVAWFQGDKDL